MNVDLRGQDAAEALLRESALVDAEASLAWLRGLHRRRTAQRRTAVFGVAILMLVGLWAAWPPDHQEAPPPVAPSSSFPPLGDQYDVVQTDISASGQRQAVAALRYGESAVVLVREAGSASLDFVWSAPTPHERADQNLHTPVAVEWSPDDSRLAVLVAQERGAGEEQADLTLLTMNPDGTERRLAEAELGLCLCSDLPSLEWSPDGRSIQVDIPTRTGPISNQVEVS